MSEILSAETMTLWRRRHFKTGLAPSTYARVIDSHEALRERVEKLERVAYLARAFQDDSTLESTASIDLSVELGAALRVLEADHE